MAGPDEKGPDAEEIGGLYEALIEVRGNGEWTTLKSGERVWCISREVYEMVEEALAPKHLREWTDEFRQELTLLAGGKKDEESG